MLADTHCHLYMDAFSDDLPAVLDRAVEAGVGHIFLPALNLGSLPGMRALEHPDIRFYPMAGVHPTEINDGVRAGADELAEACAAPDVVAVGETGLDYHWDTDHKAAQQRSLRMHCEVARACGKPVVLHNRDSTDDLLDIIGEEQDGSLTGIWHCFNGSVEEGRRALDLGLHLGIGGVFTFKNAGVDLTVSQLPLERMVLETDAPYLSPEPCRGERNEPAFVRHTAERLAQVKETDLGEVARRTTATALELFGLQV
ncbi:MAG: TatD family hydrolase [Balneolaceae bacterium]|nr:TatD family hydrolase [Balneolaceae bacterium]